MWKYVGQRIADSAEQTCTHLKNLRSTFSTCNTKTTTDVVKKDGIRGIRKCVNGRINSLWKCFESNDKQNKELVGIKLDIDTPFVIQKCYQRQKQKQHEAFHGGLELQFLQWTAGLLCSLYFGQMICIYSRRRQNLKRWHHLEQILSDRTLRQTLEKFHQSQYQRSYVPSNDVQHWYDEDQMRGIRALMPLVPVTNDHLNASSPKANTPITSAAAAATQTTRKRTEVSLAVDHLIATLGSIEFRLGMENLRAEEYKDAIPHLKLATTHRHPEATFNLGVCYETGVGVEKDMRNAMECYRMAASMGHKKAMYNLGIFYVHGRGGLRRNMGAARACFEAADKMGLRRAKLALRLPEKPVKKDDEIVWKSNDLIANKLSAVNQRRESMAI